jgi:hypothetical protein
MPLTTLKPESRVNTSHNLKFFFQLSSLLLSDFTVTTDAPATACTSLLACSSATGFYELSARCPFSLASSNDTRNACSISAFHINCDDGVDDRPRGGGRGVDGDGVEDDTWKTPKAELGGDNTVPDYSFTRASVGSIGRLAILEVGRDGIGS